MESDDEPAHMVRWRRRSDYVMSLVALALGLGNVWRFPFVAYQNGGGAFLIPYMFTLIFVSRPLYFLEMCLGQFSTKGNLYALVNMAPCLKGLGYMQVIGTLTVGVYYSTLMALALQYFAYSFTFNIPWANCLQSWESRMPEVNNATCIASNVHGSVNLTNTISSAELFFKYEILHEKDDIEDGVGVPQWKFVISMALVWIITCLVCIRDIKSSGLIAHFLTLFPVICLIILLVRAVTLPGAENGMLYYLTPEWHKLLEGKVWYYAVTQCFFSLNIGHGAIITYSAHNNFDCDIVKISWIVSIADTCTSFFSGIIVFSVLGNLAYKMHLPITDVIRSSGGTGLAFISYPETLARIDTVPWLLSITFFFMLFLLGLGCNIAHHLQGQNILCDIFPFLPVWFASILVGISLFLFSLPFATPGGQQVFTIIDYFGGSFIFFIINILELLAISYYYGLSNLCDDVEFMLKTKLGVFWRISWGLSVPVILVTILTYFSATYEEITYRDKPFPTYLLAWGWGLFIFATLQPLFWGIYDYIVHVLVKREKCSEFWRFFISHEKWRPLNDDRYNEWLEFKDQRRIEREMKNRNWFVDKMCILIGK